MEIFLSIITVIMGIIYIYYGYEAMNKLFWSKRTYIYADSFSFYLRRIFNTIIAGWIAIPIVVIQTLIGKRRFDRGGNRGMTIFFFIALISVAILAAYDYKTSEVDDENRYEKEVSEDKTYAADEKLDQESKETQMNYNDVVREDYAENIVIADEAREIPNGDSSYLISDSSVKELSEEELDGYSKAELQTAINEIYARNGRRFNTPEIQEYFNSKSWYTPEIDPEDFTEDMLNSIERKNINLLVKKMNNIE